MRFCQSFMSELHRHVGQFTDVPAGDIGVGAREIGYLFGQYKRLTNSFTGMLTGKGLHWGGSLIRPEATGYGCVYFSQEVLQHHSDQLEGKTATVSGSGNVAQYTTEKLIELGTKVVTLSDSSGYIHDPAGINKEKLNFVKELKGVKRGRISDYATVFKVKFFAKQRPWAVPCDLAYPCATQNELDKADALSLVKNGCKGVFEGANMPTTLEAVSVLRDQRVYFTPGKASNAGGVATSGLEMSQNALRMAWKREEVDNYLKNIMQRIHNSCIKEGTNKDGIVDYVKGANIAGFKKVATSILEQGII